MWEAQLGSELWGELGGESLSQMGKAGIVLTHFGEHRKKCLSWIWVSKGS